MKPLFLILLALFPPFFVLAQGPLIEQWDAGFGGNYDDYVNTLVQTADGGYLMAGTTSSDAGGDISQLPQGFIDFWIVKLDSIGNKQWEKRFGGNQENVLTSAQQTRDGGFILGGYTSSDSSGDISSPPIGGAYDCWVVKTDSLGNKQWDKRYGGTALDVLAAVQQTTDGGYIFGGSTNSAIGADVSGAPRGFGDFWIIKTDSTGNKQWDQRFGGNSGDDLYALEQTPDGGYILGGSTESIGGLGPAYGDLTQPARGLSDYWIVKTDSLGNKLWDRRFGNSVYQELHSLQQTPDGGYVLAGSGTPDSTGDYSQNGQGFEDYWMVKVDSAGNKQWDRRFGGDQYEDEFGYVRLTNDGGYLLSGTSYSNTSGDKSENNLGHEQAWVVKLNANGVKQWDKTILTANPIDDELGLAIQTRDSCYAIAVPTGSDIGGYKTRDSKGVTDYWMVKFCPVSCNLGTPPITASDTIFCANNGWAQICAPIGFLTYQWNTGDTTTCIDVSLAGNYYVTVNDFYGCVANSNHIAISVYAVPAVAISVNGDTLTAYNANSYQWYLNGHLIQGATSATYISNAAGSYTVAVTDSNGCAATSLPVVFSGIADFDDAAAAFSIYNDASGGYLSIHQTSVSPNTRLVIYDVAGNLLQTLPVTSATTRFETQNYPAGVYVAEVSMNSNARRIKWVKM